MFGNICGNFLFGDLEETKIKVLKDLILLWNIAGKVLKDLVLKWNIAGKVLKNLVLKWNITGKVLKSFIFRWKIFGSWNEKYSPIGNSWQDKY